jgi:lipopolysaccharide export system permease protein
MLLLILAGLAWMVQVLTTIKFLMNYGIELTNFLGLSMMMLPFIISIIMPFVTFIAILFVYNKMIGDNEVVVMMASGTSPGKIARPALILATILTVAHFVLNIWIVPATQANFYDTQWNLRYGLAHMKLQEATFTEISNGRVVYVEKVVDHDLSQIMLSDTHDPNAQITIFARKGKLVSTMRGLSIVMTDGSLYAQRNGNAIGTFESFDMDLNIPEKNNDSAFRARRMPTRVLIHSLNADLTEKQHKTVMSELANRFLGPFMNFILAAICVTILLRTSLLRRRTSFAPAATVLAMSVIMASFMSLSSMLSGMNELMLLGLGQLVITGIIMFILLRK